MTNQNDWGLEYGRSVKKSAEGILKPTGPFLLKCGDVVKAPSNDLPKSCTFRKEAFVSAQSEL